MNRAEPSAVANESVRLRGNIYTRAARRRLEPALLQASRARGYVQVLGNIAVFISLLWCASRANSVWLALALIPAIGLAQHRLFFPAHDCLHYSLFPNRAENRFWGVLLSALLGTSFDAIRDQHMDHHRDFGTRQDPGASDYFVRFSSRAQLLRFLLGPLAGSILIGKLGDYLLRPSRPSLESRTVQTSRVPRSGLNKLAQYCAILGVQAVVCALLSRGFQWSQLWRYGAFNVLPAVTVFLFLVRLRMFLEHGALDYATCDYVENKRPTARTIYGSRLEQVFLCGSDFNFHHEHHLYPVIPGWQLPKLHRELLAANLDHEDIRQSYLQALREIWRNLARRQDLPTQPADGEPFKSVSDSARSFR